jgi:hypothetical protein
MAKGGCYEPLTTSSHSHTGASSNLFYMPASGSLLDDYGNAHARFEKDYAKALEEQQEQQGCQIIKLCPKCSYNPKA